MAQRSPARLLVIDDDQCIRLLLQTLFERYGFEVESAPDESTALTRIRAEAWDVVIVDLVPPTPEKSRVIRELEFADPGLFGRTIVLTGAKERMARDWSGRRCRVLAKPFDIHELVAQALACVPA